MRRVLGTSLGGVAAVGALTVVVSGGGAGVSPVVLALVVVPAFAGAAVLRRGGEAGPDTRWTGAADGATRANPTEHRPATTSGAGVVRALGRVEVRELVRSPWFGTGVGFLVVIYLMFAVIYGQDNGSTWAEMVLLAPWFAHPLVGTVVLATHRAVTRARRDGADELFDACPAGASIRTAGLLVSAWVPVAAIAVFLAVLGQTLRVRSPHLHGPLGPDAVATVLGAMVLGAGGVALGTALGQWVRFSLAPIVAVVAVGFVALRLNLVGDPGWHPLTQLSTAPGLPQPDPLFAASPVWGHLVWVAALVVLVGVVGLGKHRRDRAMLGALVVVAAVAVLAGIIVTRPVSARDAERIAALVVAAPGTQDCERAADRVRVCAYRGDRELLDAVANAAAPVARALPAAAPAITLRQGYDGDYGSLPPEVRRQVPGGVPALGVGEARVGSEINDGDLLAVRLLVALVALDMPVEADPGGRSVVIAGQANGVVALWLAARGLPADEARRLATAAVEKGSEVDPFDPFYRGYAWPACSGGPVVWSAQDLEAARAILELPATEVADVVAAGWARWRDAATGTDELLAELGLPGVAPPDRFDSRGAAVSC